MISRTPLRITDGAAVLVLQIPGICLDIQDVAIGRCGLAGARLVRTRDRLEMRQSRIEARVFVELTYGLFLIDGDIECRLQNQSIGCTGRGHCLLVAAVTASQLETLFTFIPQEEIIPTNFTESHLCL